MIRRHRLLLEVRATATSSAEVLASSATAAMTTAATATPAMTTAAAAMTTTATAMTATATACERINRYKCGADDRRTRDFPASRHRQHIDTPPSRSGIASFV
ncbi:MAG: hypothetical protein U0992_05360 [Planctomycetaceae bacterium]